jgi:hypothetical protein
MNRIVITGGRYSADLVTKTLLTPSGSSNEAARKYIDMTPNGIRKFDKT